MAFNNGSCLCARGLPAYCHEEDLEALFQSYGRVTDVRMPLDPVSKANRGYAFVTMGSPSEAHACIAALHGVEFGGCRLTVDISKRSAPHVKTPGFYLGRAHGRDGSAPRTVSPGLHALGRGGRHRDGPPCTTIRGRSLPRRDAQSRSKPTSALSPGCHATASSGCILAEPLSEPLAAPATTPPAPPARGRGEPLIEPAIEPGGEPPNEEDPMCCADKAPRATEPLPESPRSRIRRLEEANIRVVGKQTADALLLQFQQQGFSDPGAAAHECLRVSIELLGKPPPNTVLSGAEPGLAVQVLLSPEEFKNPSSFLRVYGDPLAASAGRCGRHQPESHQDGNWRCEQCGNINFPRRQRCHKCHDPRGPSGDAIVMQYCLRVHEMLQKGKVFD